MHENENVPADAQPVEAHTESTTTQETNVTQPTLSDPAEEHRVDTNQPAEVETRTETTTEETVVEPVAPVQNGDAVSDNAQ